VQKLFKRLLEKGPGAGRTLAVHLEVDPAPALVEADDLVVLTADVDDGDGRGEVVVAPNPMAGDLGAGVVGEVHITAPVAGGHGAADPFFVGTRLVERIREAGTRSRLIIDARPPDGAATNLATPVQKDQLGGGRTHVDATVERIVGTLFHYAGCS
jgi:hypothetical protein